MTRAEIREAPVFNIQKFSVHDGPGIRTLVFLKGCPLRCPWCSNPESHTAEKQLVYEPRKCIGCLNCVDRCGHEALSCDGGAIAVDPTRCLVCGECEEVCYSGALTILGKGMTCGEVLREIEKDIPFYRTSGGGVTFSGGEPLLYPDFIRHIAETCREKSIHTAVETSGSVSWEAFRKVLDGIDLFLFDIKHADSAMHEKTVGSGNETILGNLKRLCELGTKEVVVRIPVIPGFNAKAADMEGIADFIRSLGNAAEAVRGVQLLPYHKYGERKYAMLGLEYPCRDLSIPTPEAMEELKGAFASLDCPCSIGG